MVFYLTGAVMYLFRGDFGCMLFTGDFRWEATNERAKIGRTMLLHALEGDRVNILYLDNSYCNPSFSFPSREAAAQQVHVYISCRGSGISLDNLCMVYSK